jgi:hypothetical protein
MDKFKMSDEIALVDYVDGETGDSEHLEGFQKFCGEQDSEGGEEETPPTSNTESAYLVDIYGGFNQEIDKLATIPQSWSGERQEVAEDLTVRQEQPKKRGMIKRIVPEMRDLDLTISTMESERETTHEDGGPAGPTMKEALLASVTKGRPQQGDGAQCSGVEVSTIGWSEPPRSLKPEGVYAQHAGKVASPSRVDKDDHEGSAREHRLDVMRRDDPELFQMFFQGAVKGIGGADGKDRVLKINRFAAKEGVRWDAELCPGCELEWLPPGSELFMKVCARCYASASSGRAVDPESVKMDVKVIGKIRGPLTPGLSIWFEVGAGWMTSLFI